MMVCLEYEDGGVVAMQEGTQYRSMYTVSVKGERGCISACLLEMD